MLDISTRNGSVPIPDIMHNMYPADSTTAEAKLETRYENIVAQQHGYPLPEVGQFYRDNVTGIIFEVLTLTTAYTCLQDLTSYDPKRVTTLEPLSIVLRSFCKNATITVPCSIFSATIEADEAYDFKGVGPYSDKKRFELTEVTAEVGEGVADQQPQVEPWSLEKIEKRLASKKKRLYVVNTMLTKHGLPDILFDFAQLHKNDTQAAVCKLPASWIPIDILSLVPRASLKENARFLALLREGHVKVISKRDYRRIMETQAAQEELARVMTTYENLREMHRPRPIKSQMTNPHEVK